MDNPSNAVDKTIGPQSHYSWLPNASAKPARTAHPLSARENLILELIDIVESSRQKRALALQSLKSASERFGELGAYAPHPLRVELMLWRAEIFFHMTAKNYARPGAKANLLRALEELK